MEPSLKAVAAPSTALETLCKAKAMADAIRAAGAMLDAGDACPQAGDLIEFEGDDFTDKGPATGTIGDVKVTVDGLYVRVDFDPGQETLPWDDMRPGLGLGRSGKRLWTVGRRAALDSVAVAKRLRDVGALAASVKAYARGENPLERLRLAQEVRALL